MTKLGRSGSLVFAARAGIHHCQAMYIQPARLTPEREAGPALVESGRPVQRLSHGRVAQNYS